MAGSVQTTEFLVARALFGGYWIGMAAGIILILSPVSDCCSSA
ncbi:MAG TPA: hypothetical protein PLK36_10595 [Methanoregulaceae archaeon]|nr:hypothetical protein [Methanoregulaceae archaeon]HQN90512.1 hypothetical protein [Methanoregulaceae archaeon]